MCLDIQLMIDVIENRLDDLLLFTDHILKEFHRTSDNQSGFGQLD